MYHADERIQNIQEKLQTTFNKIQSYYYNWKLKININKCETILFRLPLGKAKGNVAKQYKSFKLKDSVSPDYQIAHKETLRYLGINLDDKLVLTKHINTQIKKAKQAFALTRKLFYSKHIKIKVKIICYLLLIRPIITYGYPIWYNLSATTMEEIRKFERRCIRAYIGFLNSRDLETKKYKSNSVIYNIADIPRIDNHMIKLIRNHFAMSSTNFSNGLIFGCALPNDEYYQKTLVAGYIPPEAFMFLDKKGWIQDDDNIPIIYHMPRGNNRKAIAIPPNTSSRNSRINW